MCRPQSSNSEKKLAQSERRGEGSSSRAVAGARSLSLQTGLPPPRANPSCAGNAYCNVSVHCYFPRMRLPSSASARLCAVISLLGVSCATDTTRKDDQTDAQVEHEDASSADDARVLQPDGDGDQGHNDAGADESKPIRTIDATTMIEPFPPAMEEWKPPFSLSDEQGFLDSEDTHCALGAGGGAVASAWADESQVWTTITRQAYLGEPRSGPVGGEISRNTGNGWQYVTTTLPGYGAIGPYTKERLALWKIHVGTNDDPCSLATIHRKTGEVGCELTLSESRVTDVFGVNDQVAYYATPIAVFRVGQSGAAPQKVLDVGGEGVLWADQEVVVHARADGKGVMVRSQSGTTTLPAPPVGFVSDVWANSASDIWLAGTVQLRHWNGTKWRVVETGLGLDCTWPEVVHLWGAQGRIYAAGPIVFGELSDESFEPIYSWCGTEAGAYGETPTSILQGIKGMPDGKRVLLVLQPGAQGLVGTECMDVVLVLYDGQEYRRI